MNMQLGETLTGDILTALAPFLRTPNTLEICTCERRLLVRHDDHYGCCEYDDCPLAPKPKDTP